MLNYYDGDARLGLHRDGDEQVLEPIVSLSLGAARVFRLPGSRSATGRALAGFSPMTRTDPEQHIGGHESRCSPTAELTRPDPGTGRPITKEREP